jgi:ATP-dependent helicase STH1/SNF2
LETNFVQNALESKVREELNEHPELGDLDDSSRNGDSTAPTTSAGTPMPAVSSGKLKLTFNKDQYANGGSSGMQSDDDD